MANTTNLNLVKLSGSEKLKTYPTNQAGNMDTIDSAFGAGFGLSGNPSVNTSINNLADGLAIVANGNTHAAITSGQFVYVRNHGSLSEGLYVATANISANGTLSGSNLTADTAGGLNSVYASLNSKIDSQSLAPITTLTSSANMNSVDVGTYRQDGTSMPTNAPANANNATIIVTKAREQDRFQIWASINSNLIFFRKTNAWNNGTSSSWSDWESLALNSNIPSGNTFAGGYRFMVNTKEGNYSLQFDLDTSTGRLYMYVKNAQGTNVFSKYYNPAN